MSQWKPKKLRQKASRRAREANQRTPIEVNPDVCGARGGIEVSVLEGPQGWMRPDDFDRYRGPYKGMQMSICPHKGQVWVKVIIGRHRRMDEASLRERLHMLEQVAAREGGQVELDSGPLWRQVEFLENVLEFRLRPPCGCPPSHSAAAA